MNNFVGEEELLMRQYEQATNRDWTIRPKLY